MSNQGDSRKRGRLGEEHSPRQGFSNYPPAGASPRDPGGSPRYIDYDRPRAPGPGPGLGPGPGPGPVVGGPGNRRPYYDEPPYARRRGTWDDRDGRDDFDRGPNRYDGPPDYHRYPPPPPHDYRGPGGPPPPPYHYDRDGRDRRDSRDRDRIGDRSSFGLDDRNRPFHPPSPPYDPRGRERERERDRDGSPRVADWDRNRLGPGPGGRIIGGPVPATASFIASASESGGGGRDPASNSSSPRHVRSRSRSPQQQSARDEVGLRGPINASSSASAGGGSQGVRYIPVDRDRDFRDFRDFRDRQGPRRSASPIPYRDVVLHPYRDRDALVDSHRDGSLGPHPHSHSHQVHRGSDPPLHPSYNRRLPVSINGPSREYDRFLLYPPLSPPQHHYYSSHHHNPHHHDHPAVSLPPPPPSSFSERRDFFLLNRASDRPQPSFSGATFGGRFPIQSLGDDYHHRYRGVVGGAMPPFGVFRLGSPQSRGGRPGGMMMPMSPDHARFYSGSGTHSGGYGGRVAPRDAGVGRYQYDRSRGAANHNSSHSSSSSPRSNSNNKADHRRDSDNQDRLPEFDGVEETKKPEVTDPEVKRNLETRMSMLDYHLILAMAKLGVKADRNVEVAPVANASTGVTATNNAISAVNNNINSTGAVPVLSVVQTDESKRGISGEAAPSSSSVSVPSSSSGRTTLMPPESWKGKTPHRQAAGVHHNSTAGDSSMSPRGPSSLPLPVSRNVSAGSQELDSPDQPIAAYSNGSEYPPAASGNVNDRTEYRDSRDSRERERERTLAGRDRETRDNRDFRDFRDLRDTRDPRDLRDMRDFRDYRDPRDNNSNINNSNNNMRDFRDFRDDRGRDPRDIRDTRDVRDIRDIRDVRDVRDHRWNSREREPPPPPMAMTMMMGRDGRDRDRDGDFRGRDYPHGGGFGGPPPYNHGGRTPR